VKNITIAVDEKVHRRARIQAAEQDLSMSAYIAKLLTEASTKPAHAETPYEQILALREDIRGFAVGPKISRDELHERHNFR